MKKQTLTSMKEMARGYQEMGELNLEISNAYFFLEEEGEKINEMGAEKSKKRAI